MGSQFPASVHGKWVLQVPGRTGITRASSREGCKVQTQRLEKQQVQGWILPNHRTEMLLIEKAHFWRRDGEQRQKCLFSTYIVSSLVFFTCCLKHRLRNPESWIHIPGLALTSMILGKLPKLSAPWFFICKMGTIITTSS